MNWNGRKVLITGGAGFLGSHLTDALVSKGAEVTVLDIFPDGMKNLEHIKDKIKTAKIDIGNLDEITKLTLEFEYIFHLAAVAVPKACDVNPSEAFRTNVLGTYNMLKFSLKCPLKKFIFPSSALLYGTPQYVPIDEKHPIEIMTNYTATKKIGEDMCRSFSEMHKSPVLFFRLFNAYGPRQSRDYLIPTMICQALSEKSIKIWDDKPTRDWTFVADTVNAFVLGAESDFLGGPVNIGTGVECKVGDFVKKIADMYGASIILENKPVTGPSRLCCNNSFAKQAIGWESKINLDSGLKTTIDWYKSN